MEEGLVAMVLSIDELVSSVRSMCCCSLRDRAAAPSRGNSAQAAVLGVEEAIRSNIWCKGRRIEVGTG